MGEEPDLGDRDGLPAEERCLRDYAGVEALLRQEAVWAEVPADLEQRIRLAIERPEEPGSS